MSEAIALASCLAAAPVFNLSTRRVGGIRFVKIGRFTISFCVSSAFRPIKAPRR